MYGFFDKPWIKNMRFLLSDIISYQIAYIIIFVYIYNSFSDKNYDYFSFLFVSTVASFCVSFFSDNYIGIYKRGYLEELKYTIKYVTYVYALIIIYFLLEIEGEVHSKTSLIFIWPIALVVVYIFRIIAKKTSFAKKNNKKYSVLIVTEKAYIPEIIENFKDSSRDISIKGFVITDEDISGKLISGIKVVGSSIDCVGYVKSHVIDGVFFYYSRDFNMPRNIENNIVNMGIAVHRVIAKAEKYQSKMRVENFSGYTVLTSSIKIVSVRQLFIKRVTDIAFGTIGVFITALVYIVVAPIIYIKSPGPIFFSQTRIGKNGRKFKIYKFRSMYMNAEDRKKELMSKNRIADGLMFKMDDDPRIIKGIGHFIREYSLDELPQFWNVLKGEMSLVGTRPPTLDEYEKYESHHMARLAIKPGITGLWQVNGRSNILDFEDVVAIDVKYITDWSLTMDIKIIFKTVAVIFKREGSM